MGYLNSKIYEDGINNTFLSSSKKYVIALTNADIKSAAVDVNNIAAVSAIINGGGIVGNPSLSDGYLNNVFEYSNKVLTIKSLSYNYTKDVLSGGAGEGETDGKYNDVASITASHFAVIEVDADASSDYVEITPFSGAEEKIKIPTSTTISSGTVVITGQLSGSGVTIQPNNNFLFGSVGITFSESDS